MPECYKKPHLPLTLTEPAYKDVMTNKESVIREKLWKNVGLAADIMEKIEKGSVDTSGLDAIFDKYEGLTSESDGTVDVFKTEMFRTVKCIGYFNENNDLKREQAEELNRSFEMLKEIARELDITIK